MARLVVARRGEAEPELWIITDAGNGIDPTSREFIKGWPGPRRGINRPSVADYHAWQRRLQRKTGDLRANCPECDGKVFVRSHIAATDSGWHWYHRKRAEGCRIWRSESDTHFRLKNETAAIARELGLKAVVEEPLIFPDGLKLVPDVLITGGTSRHPLDWEIEESGRKLTTLEDWYGVRARVTPRRVIEAAPSAYQPAANVPQLVRDRGWIVAGLVDHLGRSIEMQREEVVDAVCRNRVAIDPEEAVFRLLTASQSDEQSPVRTRKPKRKNDPRDTAGATPWLHPSPPNSEPLGPQRPGASTPSPFTATSSALSTTRTPPTLSAGLSKSCQPLPLWPGSDTQPKPTGSAGTHPTPTARTAAATTSSPTAPTSPRPATSTSPRPAEGRPGFATQPLFSLPALVPTLTTTSKGRRIARSAGSTTSLATLSPAGSPGTAPAAMTSPGRGARAPVATSAPSGLDRMVCPWCTHLVAEDFVGPCPRCRSNLTVSTRLRAR